MTEIINRDLINIVYYLLLGFVFACVFYMLDRLYRTNKKAFILVIVFPPLLIYYLWKNYHEFKENILYFIIFVFVIIALGTLVQRPFASNMFSLFYKIFLWPVYVGKLLYSYIT